MLVTRYARASSVILTALRDFGECVAGSLSSRSSSSSAFDNNDEDMSNENDNNRSIPHKSRRHLHTRVSYYALSSLLYIQQEMTSA